MSSYADSSSHTVMARAYDTSGRIAQSSQSVTLDKSVNLSVDTPPAYTNAASLPITFTTDSDASVKFQVNGGSWFGVLRLVQPADLDRRHLHRRLRCH
jgi:hypothetical protein